jgi:tetratricopeptide (TPR) repeat protein
MSITTAARDVPPPSASDPQVTAQLARLRTESEATESSVPRAALLHELGVLSERLGDEADATRDHLNAVNTEPEFREPLERLISIVERRQSFKNLGKLLERVAGVAESASEKTRILLDLGLHRAEHEDNFAEARATLEEALALDGQDAALWLALEWVAVRLGDESLRGRALAARAELTRDATWKGLLLVDLARCLERQDDLTGAATALEQAVDAGGRATYAALAALEEIARRAHRDESVARALAATLELVEGALDDPKSGVERGVPRHIATPLHAAGIAVRASLAFARAGHHLEAVRVLERSLTRLPNDPVLLHLRLGLADAVGDVALAASLAERRLRAGVGGALGAASWLRVTEAAAANGDPLRALEAVRQALALDSGSIPARALELDLLENTAAEAELHPETSEQTRSAGAALAAALEGAADALGSDEAKARFFLLAADAWARLGGDRQNARTALSQAGLSGTHAATVARVARFIASATRDAAWYEEATRRLLATGAPETEQTSLWLELLRSRLLRKDHASLAAALEGLAAAPGGHWAAAALRAFVIPLLVPLPEHTSAAVTALAALSTLEADDDEASRALTLLVALRSLSAGDAERAESELERLHTTDPGDAVASLAYATLCRQRGRAARAGEVLTATALATTDSELGAALALEGGLLQWRAGERTAALESFRTAGSLSGRAADFVLRWALRAADPNSLGARRAALESDEEDPLSCLERFALEVAHGGDPDDGWRALDGIDGKLSDELAETAALARALFARDIADPARRAALASVGTFAPDALAVVRATEFQMELERGAAAAEIEVAARRWAELDPAPAAALEWVGAALELNNVPREADARSELARRLGGEAGLAVEASARLLRQLAGVGDQPLFDANDPVAKLMNLELAGPGCDPRRRATALLGLDDSLGEESRELARLLAGYNQLAAGDLAGAESVFRSYTERQPEDLLGWEGLRAVGEQRGNRGLVAEACAALGDLVADAAYGAELWETAALILIDELSDPDRGRFALGRAVERDIRRFVAFDRLFRVVRADKDGPRLLELIAARLEVAEDPTEIAKLFWERARVLRQENRIDEALAALENVTLLEPDHVGALALSGEIYIKRGRFGEAAENLAKLATLDEAPKQQRLMSGIAAVDLYENKLNESERALDVLVALHRAQLSTLPVRERLARTAAKTGSWERATEILEELMIERERRDGRIEAARLAMVIHRDKLGRPARAEAAVRKLLAESPTDGEALELVLSGALPANVASVLAERGTRAVVEALGEDPLQAELVDRLARLAAFASNAPLRQAALGALVAIGEGTPEIDHELSVLDARVARLPQIAIDASALPDLCDPEDRGPIAELFALLAPTLAEALGPGLSALGVNRKQRVDPRAGLPVRNEIAAWAGALGVGDFELYVGGTDERGVFGVPGEKPTIVIGSAVTAPLSPAYRQAVARELFAVKRGTAILRHRDATDVAAMVIATCRISGLDPTSPHYAMLDEFQRLIGRELPRRLKKPVQDLAQAIASEQRDPVSWVPAAISSLDRLAAVAAGDVSHVLAASTGERGRIGPSIEAQQRASRLLAFVLSPKYLALREQLGMGVR